MRSMRCYVDPRQLYIFGYLPLLLLRRCEEHYMPGLQGAKGVHDNNDYRTSWKGTKERLAGASIRTHTHGIAHCTLGTLEKDHIQAAKIWLEQT